MYNDMQNDEDSIIMKNKKRICCYCGEKKVLYYFNNKRMCYDCISKMNNKVKLEG